MNSIWEQTAQREERPALKENLHTDVAVIGAGMAGVLTAFLLRRHGVDCVVLEAARIGSGQTAGTTAKITSQHGLVYHGLIERFGEAAARQYARINQRAIGAYRRMSSALFP